MIYTYWHTLALHDALPFFQRVFSAAILLDNCAILRHVDKAASQIARIRRLERRVGKALAGAVRRVEILEDGEAFLKVRDNWRFNDLAGRLGHQATHARKQIGRAQV